MSAAPSGTAVEEFAAWHDGAHGPGEYRRLIPLRDPGPGEQYAFEVNLDRCTGCKACVVACHNLNGLDEDESWRDVGELTGVSEPYLQTVTSACHHCEDPACANGCPVLAYEKNPQTGIVRHLDDQCIGCSYCILKCPYDVPKFNKKRNIVRKCDLCQGRLAAGEAPACVQACPTSAITIRLVPTAAAGGLGERLVPGVFDSGYTRPTTRYVSSRPIPADAVPGGAGVPRLEEGHSPLAVMLVLTQWAAGILTLSWGQSRGALVWFACGLAAAGIGASMAHLGQPLKACRAFLGWRRSWLSREVISFGAFLPLVGASAPGWIPTAWAAVAGMVSVWCSIMVYADTRRPLWSLGRTSAAFFGTAAVLGAATVWGPGPGTMAAVVKLAGEAACLCRACGDSSDVRSVSARLRLGPAKGLLTARFACGIAGMAALWLNVPLGVVLLAAGELLERSLFFRTCPALRMPGV